MKILVIGDSCLDIFQYGICERLCPEAPVPIFTPHERVSNPGMAANVEANLKGLGCDTVLLSNTNRSSKTRLIDTRVNQIVVRIDYPHPDIDALSIDRVKKILNRRPYDAILISDYDKGYLTYDTIKEIIPLHPLVFIDTKKPLVEDFIHPNVWIKINESEYNNTLKESKVDVACWDQTIITLGERGCMYKNKIYPPATQDKVRDVCGAGDTFLASLVYGYLKDGCIELAIELANRCSAWAVDQPGVVAITKQVTEELGIK